MTIASRQNPLVKQLRKLHHAKHRREQNLFLLEGTHLIETAYAANSSFDTLCCTDLWLQKHPQLWQRVSKRANRQEKITSSVLSAIATTVHPDGVIATVKKSQIKPQLQNLQLGLMLERLQDPGNLGTILRTALAAGVDGVWLSDDSVDSDNPKVLRASAGASFHLPIAISHDLAKTITEAQSYGIRIIATTSVASQTYWKINWNQPNLILLGNEGSGLSEELLSLADERVMIPLDSRVESLNVAIASSLLLYEAIRQRNLPIANSDHNDS